MLFEIVSTCPFGRNRSVVILFTEALFILKQKGMSLQTVHCEAKWSYAVCLPQRTLVTHEDLTAESCGQSQIICKVQILSENWKLKQLNGEVGRFCQSPWTDLNVLQNVSVGFQWKFLAWCGNHLVKHFGMGYRDPGRQLERSLVILRGVSMKSTCLFMELLLLRPNFLERLGTTCSSHYPSEGYVFQRQIIQYWIRSQPVFNIEEEVCLRVTIYSCGNKKKKEEEEVSRL